MPAKSLTHSHPRLERAVDHFQSTRKAVVCIVEEEDICTGLEQTTIVQTTSTDQTIKGELASPGAAKCQIGA